MDGEGKMARDAKIVLLGAVVYLVFSFFDWQQVSLLGLTAGQTEWHGIGILAGLLAVAVVVWELARDYASSLSVGGLTPGVTSLLLAVLLALFTVIAFLTKSEFRHWPAWAGLILALLIGAAAGSRARREGVQFPTRTA